MTNNHDLISTKQMNLLICKLKKNIYIFGVGGWDDTGYGWKSFALPRCRKGHLTMERIFNFHYFLYN